MNLSLKGFSQLVEDMAAALQGSAATIVDVSAGSVLRAIFEANASVALWLQWLLLRVLQTTRAATSSGADLDSWMADFNLTRLPASAATGTVTFSRYVNTLPATIPVGSIVKTSDGTISFSVTADATLSTWQAPSNGYVIPGGVSAVTVPVTCLTYGSAGNVLANAITTIASSLPGIDQVINPAGLTNGRDAETDDAFRVRFRSYLASLSRATVAAVRNAAISVQQGLSVVIQENTGPDGNPAAGSFLLTVDDGSGYPSSSLLSAVAGAVDVVRPIGTAFVVRAPEVITANVTLLVTLSSSASAAAYVSNIQQAVATYLNSLPIGGAASLSRIAQCGYAVGSEIVNLSGIMINGQASDLAPPAQTVIKAGQITVTPYGG